MCINQICFGDTYLKLREFEVNISTLTYNKVLDFLCKYILLCKLGITEKKSY